MNDNKKSGFKDDIYKYNFFKGRFGGNKELDISGSFKDDIYKDPSEKLLSKTKGFEDDINETKTVVYKGKRGNNSNFYNREKQTPPKQETPLPNIVVPPETKTNVRQQRKELRTPKTTQERYIIRNLVNLVLDNIPIINLKNHLYYYSENVYKELLSNDLICILHSLLDNENWTDDVIFKFDQVFKILHGIPKIKLKEAPVYKNKIFFNNGIFDLKSNAFYRYSKDVIVFSKLKIDFNQDVNPETPMFDSFLNSASMGNPEIIERVYMMIGYLLISDYTGKYFFFVGTSPDSGKSLFGNVIKRMFHNQNISAIPINGLSDNALSSDLVGKALNISMDLPDEIISSKAVSVLKSATGGDYVQINQKYIASYQHKNTAKFVFSSNFPLRLKSGDPAFFNRLIFVPFIKTVKPENQIHNLEELIFKEIDGIVNKAIKAVKRLIQNNFIFPECTAADKMMLNWRDSPVNSAEYFIRNFCEESETEKTHSHELYSVYKAFCDTNDIDYVEKDNSFSRHLTDLGYVQDRWGDGSDQNPRRGFLGLRIADFSPPFL